MLFVSDESVFKLVYQVIKKIDSLVVSYRAVLHLRKVKAKPAKLKGNVTLFSFDVIDSALGFFLQALNDLLVLNERHYTGITNVPALHLAAKGRNFSAEKFHSGAVSLCFLPKEPYL